jgi:putative pyruvate formate lyase activating enzyme
VSRTENEKGYCNTGRTAFVSIFSPHFGEEPMLVGTKGSGTIFFTHCNLKYRFCQNYDISIQGSGGPVTEDQIVSVMIYLQKLGCHNINLVTPTHVVSHILKALEIAAKNGLHIPLIYNCSGYESLDTLKIMDGVVDIYMPDFKFWDPGNAQISYEAQDYPEKAKAALKEMFRQTDDLKMDKKNVVVSGLLVRHLVMPEDFANTGEIIKFIREEVSLSTYINVMSQYRPMGEACDIPALRPITKKEFRSALQTAKDTGLNLIR